MGLDKIHKKDLRCVLFHHRIAPIAPLRSDMKFFTELADKSRVGYAADFHLKPPHSPPLSPLPIS